MNQDLNTDELIKKIDAKITELEKTENYKKDTDFLKNIQLEINNLENNINLIYEKHLKELNKLIGLEEVKQEIKKLINYLIFLKKIDNDFYQNKVNLNMIFRGNPGTGKTIVAQAVSNILCDLGFLNSNIVLKTTPKDFIAEYVGQTALKTRKTIDKAKGGVIFIDEAYTFYQSATDDGHTFVYEAITEIIKEMETCNTVFIFAGYEKEMDNFINLNPGIKSRVAYDISFKDYSKEELFQMFNNKIKNFKMKLSPNAEIELLNKIKEKMQSKNFGNGRMIDNLFNEILREHAANNLYETDKEKLLIITKETIQNIIVKKEGGMCFE